ncbi:MULTISPECIES: GTP-binding protein [unclassified Cellulophaga]|uniref:GTP-binding protein n=1 Tax=unclassified Cellulophaga TaxID=2634405 RepID=UPI0026E35BBD|nr:MULTISPECIES: GTP-binding protein [unclassified Cellulophaga]MDO6491923.1 GTP-binding protein [Cellulophaga sp. 2_MG-2023]MDO6495422.1 GTP-binding protein [Cellulophaga sp. 3_MG-2023]
MKTLPNDIVLRPRFQLKLDHPSSIILHQFENTNSNDITCKRLDEHLFLKIKPKNIHFWSPQLHLELDSINKESCKIYGVFGPNPSLWTFFMFIHFAIAIAFLIFAIWGYTNWSLNKSYFLQLTSIIFMSIIWVSLYIFGRIGKQKGKPQMNELYAFMQQTIAECTA